MQRCTASVSMRDLVDELDSEGKMKVVERVERVGAVRVYASVARSDGIINGANRGWLIYGHPCPTNLRSTVQMRPEHPLCVNNYINLTSYVVVTVLSDRLGTQLLLVALSIRRLYHQEMWKSNNHVLLY